MHAAAKPARRIDAGRFPAPRTRCGQASARHGKPGDPTRSLRFWLLCLVLLGPSWVRADWSGFDRFPAVAELRIEPAYAELNLRMTAESLPRLGQLTALADGNSNPERVSRRLLKLQDEHGKAMDGTLTDLRHERGRTGDATPLPEYYEAIFRFPLTSPPETLKLIPAPGTSGEIGVIVLDRGIPVSDLAPLHGPVTLRRDVRDPWNSRLDDPALVRRHAEPRSFLYVEPYEVRHELLVRLADLKPWLDMHLQDANRLTDDEKADVSRKIGALLATHTHLAVDGESVAPQVDRVDFVRFARGGVQPLEPGPVDVNAALLGVVLVYLTDKPADTVRLTWDLFRESSATRPVSVLFGRESFDSYVTAAHPDFEWSRDEALSPDAQPPAIDDPVPPAAEPGGNAQATQPFRLAPLVGLLTPVMGWFVWLLNPRRRFAGAGLALCLGIGGCMSIYPVLMETGRESAVALDEQALRAALPPLLHNAYRAFQLRGEEAAYDRLALSLDGALLEETYLQQRRALLRQGKGLGGEGRVDRIEIMQADVEGSRDGSHACSITAEWIAHGTVSHWGHAHPRQNRYRARLALRAGSDRRPKIVAMEFLDGQSLDPGPAS